MADSGVSFLIDVGVQAAGADSAAASMDTLTDKLVGVGNEAPKVAATFETDMGEIGESAEGASVNMRALSAGLGKLGGPLGLAGQQAAGFAGGLQKVSAQLGAAGPYAVVAIAVVAVASAFAVATVAMLKFAVSAADTARTSSLLSAGIARSVQGGAELDAAISALGNKVPQTREELQSMASDLANTGLRGKALSDALEVTAVKAAKLKWGPDFAKQMLSLDNQSAKLKANFSALFSGLKIDSLLEGLSQLVKLFDANESSGKAIKVVFESLFQPLVDGITAAIPKVIGGILQLEIWFLKAAIFVKPFTSTILYVAEILGGILVTAILLVGAAVLISFLPFLIAIAVTVALIAALIWLGGAAVDAGKWIAKGIGDGFDWITGKVQGAIAFLQGISLSQIGTDLIAGLVNGIKAAGGAVLASLTGIVTGAVDGVKGLLGIHSPSTVFASIGMNTAAGMAGGVDDHAGKVQGALEDMVSPPSVSPSGLASLASPDAAKAAPAGATPAPAGKSGSSYAGAVFNFYGVQGAEDAQERFLAMLEGDMAQAGRAVPA